LKNGVRLESEAGSQSSSRLTAYTDASAPTSKSGVSSYLNNLKGLPQELDLAFVNMNNTFVHIFVVVTAKLEWLNNVDWVNLVNVSWLPIGQ
jgi:hypothetical protein